VVAISDVRVESNAFGNVTQQFGNVTQQFVGVSGLFDPSGFRESRPPRLSDEFADSETLNASGAAPKGSAAAVPLSGSFAVSPQVLSSVVFVASEVANSSQRFNSDVSASQPIIITAVCSKSRLFAKSAPLPSSPSFAASRRHSSSARFAASVKMVGSELILTPPPEPGGGGDSSQGGEWLTTRTIALIAVGAALLIAAAIIVAVLLLKKRMSAWSEADGGETADHEMMGFTNSITWGGDDEFHGVTQMNQMFSTGENGRSCSDMTGTLWAPAGDDAPFMQFEFE
jgi:hypothetical protein